VYIEKITSVALLSLTLPQASFQSSQMRGGFVRERKGVKLL